MNNADNLMRIIRTGGNPQKALQQMAASDPRVSRFMQMINGKSPDQLRVMAQNIAKDKGVNLEDLINSIRG